ILLKNLNALETAGLIRLAAVQPELEYLFRHALVQDAAYGSLLKQDRKSLHKAVGEALELLYPQQRDELAATLALHFEKADAHEKALHYFALAGERASESYANTEAIAFYESAITQAEQMRETDARIAALREGIGDVYKRIGQHDAARKQYSLAHELQQLLPQSDTLMQARVHRKIGATLTIQRQFAEALQVWDEAESLLGSLSDESEGTRWDEWIEIQVERVWNYYWRSAIAEMEQLCDTFIPLVNRRGTTEQRARALTAYGLYRFRRERFVASDETMIVARKSLEDAVASQNVPLQCDAYFGLGFFHLFRRELPEAEENMRVAFTFAERMGSPVHIARHTNYMMVLARMRGQIEKAQSYFPMILANTWAGPMADYTHSVKGCEAWIAWRKGDLETVETRVAEAIASSPGGWAINPMKWGAFFPALGVAVQKKQIVRLVESAQDLLAPIQLRLPDDLTAALEKGIQLAPQDAEAALAAFADSISLAQGYGYL
ncbi:MAG TPA: hypothetical protein VFZ34_26195, partial [Blastocatellia bacterium]|nr:hypothetical protein [Blastocatellia bacterium]